MAANTGAINLTIAVEDKASSDFGKITNKIKGHLDTLANKAKGVLRVFTDWRTIIGMLAGTAGIGLLTKKVIELASAQELAEKKLEAAMRSTGRYNVNLMDSFKTYASALQATTAIGDETILGVMAMLQTFKLEEDVLKDATKATLDLAKATGQDLMSAAILVGKAAVGETGMLSRYGIIVDEAAYKAKGFQAVLEEINMEFGGQAAAQAETFAGKIGMMKSYFGDLLEKIGDMIIKNPVVLKAIDAVTEKFKTWTEYLDQNKDQIMNWATNTGQTILNWLTSIWIKIETIFGGSEKGFIGLLESMIKNIESFVLFVDTITKPIQWLWNLSGAIEKAVLGIPDFVNALAKGMQETSPQIPAGSFGNNLNMPWVNSGGVSSSTNLSDGFGPPPAKGSQQYWEEYLQNKGSTTVNNYFNQNLSKNQIIDIASQLARQESR